ncbi:MAG: response regulator, partial [Candidatus Zixiibacteriota bacterium]
KIDLKWRNKAKKKNIVIKIKSSVNEAFIKGSEEDLYILLDKLIENGIDFAYDNTSIDIIISSENKYYNVSVRNKGSQIETHLKKKIFYPFYSTKDSQGAGLGLAIVYGIVARHGGKISLESNQHSGTVFTVKFPRPEMINEESEITRRQRKFENLKILIVDDDEQIREVLDDMLTIEGHNITTCSDGSSALKKFEEDTFDLLITDLGMPGMSGLELAGKIHKKNPDLPIAMITGWGTQLNTDEIKVKGIKAVLPKPFHLKDIKSLIHEIVIKD